jgi:CRP-like cAMP-binding protein
VRRHRPDGRGGGPSRLELHQGQLVFEQGTRGDRIYIVESRMIEIVRARPDGLEDLIATIPPGERFGEMGPSSGCPGRPRRVPGPTR